MARFSVEAVFSAIDKMSAPINKMTGNTDKFAKSVRRDFAKAQRSVENFNRSIKKKLTSAVKIGAVSAMAALTLATGIAVREFVQFDKAIISSAAKFKDLVPGSVEAKKAIEDLRKVARKTGADTQFSATEAGQGLEFLAMAGFTSKQAMQLLPGVVNLATIANTDLAKSTDIASDALGAFGLMSTDSAKLGQNFVRLQDVMAKTVTSTNTDLETLFEAIKFGAPAFTIAGQSLESFSAIAGRMAANGIKGTNAGTALRSGMIRLQDPPKQAAAAIDKLGLKIGDSSGKMRPIIDIMKDMSVKMQKLTPIQKSASLAAIFGKNAFSAWASIMNEGVGQTEELSKALLKSTGAAAAMAAEIRKSLSNRLAALKSSAIELGFKFIEAFEKKGGGAIDKLTQVVRNFDPAPIIDGMKFVAKIFVGVANAVDTFSPLILTLVGIFAIYKAALIAVAIKQVILNIAMTANPVGLIVVAVGVLIGLFLSLAKATGGIGNAFKVIGKVIMQAVLFPVNLVIDSIKGLLFLMSKIPGVGDTFNDVLKVVEGFQAKLNKPFEITEFEDAKKKKKKSEKFEKPEFPKPPPGPKPFDFGGALPRTGAKASPTKREQQQQMPLVTQRSVMSTFMKTSEEKTTNVNIRNQSRNNVDSGGRQIPTGSSLLVPSSG